MKIIDEYNKIRLKSVRKQLLLAEKELESVKSLNASVYSSNLSTKKFLELIKQKKDLVDKVSNLNEKSEKLNHPYFLGFNQYEY